MEQIITTIFHKSIMCAEECTVSAYLSKTMHLVSVLGQDEGYYVKYNPLPEEPPLGKAQGYSLRQRAICDLIS